MNEGQYPTPFVSSGLDIVSIDRLRDLRDEFGTSFTRRVFTANERDYCEQTRVPAEHYAARWAAKEAFRKMIPAPEEMPRFDAVAVERTGEGPELQLDDTAATTLADSLRAKSVAPDRTSVSVSLSHDRNSDTAGAEVTAFGFKTDA
ncbi:holo-ACP synthase [Haloarcula salinisoli]|uniref:4'-phosphopantetheinyl transferase superfamily protein n=1 Tax=Haloarcula salinisoli TaxID=2487746 RepID=A0A8J7YMQ4_9EURY|nr:4'-phosphopantetheinyl transferase superfamily protein [Halomicroarcula salinisoli]MBX0288653.1 4'-phosphopantetheinyl transferase superfamily protein [Halomicroarcula salinisoli]MBX0306054.1 4'-phosphopantetheinyl transferase superfamily protein [Halomicroarcula salinisoli]